MKSPRSNLTAAGVLLIVTVLFYWKLLLTNQFSLLTGYEAVNQAYSWFSFWVRGIQQGAWPLWEMCIRDSLVGAEAIKDGCRNNHDGLHDRHVQTAGQDR